MDSKITINIVEPGSGPTSAPVVPNTGLFTSGIGGPEATAIGAVLILTIAAIVVAILYRKQKKAGKVTKLVHLVDSTKAVLKSKKRITAGLSAIALLASAGTLTTLLASANKNNTNAVEGDGLTLDVTGGDITIEVGSDPVFAVAEVETTVKEATQAGYTLTAHTDNTDLVSTTDSSKVIPMVAASEGELAALANNTYGLALGEKPTTKDAEVYMPLSIDSDAPTILKATDYIETEAEDTTTIYYGFYITPDVPYGTYTGTNINYNAEPHYITNLSFNGNGNDGGVDMEGMTIIAGDTITLPENTFTKEGYNFIGWNTVAEPTEQDPGEAYEDQAEYTAVQGETKDVTLYAQWEEATLYMQDVAKWGSKLEIGDEKIAVDNRDNKEYYVARLADGNIWMTQNLDLDLNSQTTLTQENTNISANWTPANSIISFTGTSVSGWSDNSKAPYSADPGSLYIYSSGTTADDEQYTSLEACREAHPDCSAHNHAGNYYNWTAAVAMNSSSYYTTNYKDVDQSICPAGWRLPNGPQNSTNVFEDNKLDALIVSQDGIAGEQPTYCGGLCPFYYYQDGGFNKIRTMPSWLVRSGLVDRGSLSSIGSDGGYWSSTIKNGEYAYSLYFNSTCVSTADGYNRYNGFSVRCLAE